MVASKAMAGVLMILALIETTVSSHALPMARGMPALRGPHHQVSEPLRALRGGQHNDEGSVEAQSEAAASSVANAEALTAAVKFQWQDDRGKLHTVQVTGSWTEWGEIHTLTPGKHHMYETILQIPPGKYQYKFILDGKEWVCSDAVPIETDGMGNKNNVLEITEAAIRRNQVAGQGNKKPASLVRKLIGGVVKLGSLAAVVALAVYVYQQQLIPKKRK